MNNKVNTCQHTSSARRTSMSLATRPDIRGFQSLMIPDSVMKKSVMDSLILTEVETCRNMPVHNERVVQTHQ
jgi:hypothetical protein